MRRHVTLIFTSRLRRRDDVLSHAEAAENGHSNLSLFRSDQTIGNSHITRVGARESLSAHVNRPCTCSSSNASSQKTVVESPSEPFVSTTAGLKSQSPNVADDPSTPQSPSGENGFGNRVGNPPSKVYNYVEFANFSSDQTCERCVRLQQVVKALHESETVLIQEREDLQREMRHILRREAKLRRELLETREADPTSREIREVMDYWRMRLNHPTAKTPMDGERASKVRSALKNFTVPELKEAVDGCARRPYVGNEGRQSHNGTGSKKFDDLSLILRNETTIERFRVYLAEDRKAEREKVLHRPAHEFLEGLHALGCDSCPIGQNEWEAVCPGCRKSYGEAWCLSLTGKGLKCERGCDSLTLAEMLTEAMEISRLLDEADRIVAAA